MNKWLIATLGIFLLAGCNLKDATYQAPAAAEAAQFFVYIPATEQKSTSKIYVYLDQAKVGEVGVNQPLQFSVALGWHTLTARRQSSLGPKEELAAFDMMVDKNQIYYVRFDKTTPASVLVGSPLFGVVDEHLGRQMQ